MNDKDLQRGTPQEGPRAPALDLASRLTDAAAPTHVVASRAVQERVPDLSWRDAGEHRLEGVSDPVELFVLPHADGDRADGDGR